MYITSSVSIRYDIITAFCIQSIVEQMTEKQETKTWMGVSWQTNEYIDGVGLFLDFVFYKSW